MLQIESVYKQYSTRVLLEGATAHLRPGSRVGLVGPNGAGKTTLFRMILGEESPDKGTIRKRPRLRVGYLPQELETITGKNVLDATHRDIYPEHEAERILMGLGFSELDFGREVEKLSGGYRMRVALAHLLLSKPDVLMLDEDGEKCLVPLAAEASAFVVLAATPEGSAAFIVERDRAGLVIGEREKNMGIKALATHPLSLKGVSIPESNRLPDLDLPRWLDHGRVANAAMACGLARGCFEFARDYAKERKAFGVPIAQKQAVAFMLADMAIEVDAIRLLTWEAAWRLDTGLPATTESARASRYAASSTLRVADNALQVLGGHGYIRDYPVELWLRNARGFSTFEGLATV